MTDRELMQMALNAMESFENGTNGLYKGEFAEERKALRDRLAQPEPDDLTVAYMSGLNDGKKKREWVGLTDEEIDYLEDAIDPVMYRVFARRIEAKLKEKNI